MTSSSKITKHSSIRGTKPHVPSACTNCKKAHLACDLSRPCHRCQATGKCDTCKDVQHKKRGRPRSKPSNKATKITPMEHHMFQFPSKDTSSYLFVTPHFHCLRLEEPQVLLDYGLLSLVNRNILDFVDTRDHRLVAETLDGLKRQVSERLTNQPMGGVVDPSVFQQLPLDHLLRQRVFSDIAANISVHLRTSRGEIKYLDLHISLGSMKGNWIGMDDIYFICRITQATYSRRNKTDALYLLASVTEQNNQAGKIGLPPLSDLLRSIQ